jgi:hypothetical protein
MRRSPKSAAGAILFLLTLVSVCSALTTRSARAATVFSNYTGLNCSCGFGGGFFAEAFSPTGDSNFAGAAPYLQYAFREDQSFSMGLYSATNSGAPGSPLWTSGTVTVPALSATLVSPIYGGPPISLQSGNEYFLVLNIPGNVEPIWIGDGLSPVPAFRSADGVSWSSIGEENLQFEIFGTALGAAIPEPAPWALLLLGFGLAAFVTNRRAHGPHTRRRDREAGVGLLP